MVAAASAFVGAIVGLVFWRFVFAYIDFEIKRYKRGAYLLTDGQRIVEKRQRDMGVRW